MKRLYFYSIISIMLLILGGCTQREDTQLPVETFKTTFTAVMEGGDHTKAILGESAEDGYRELLWEPGDSIDIYCRSLDYVASYTGHIFRNVATTNSTQATFEGSMCRSHDIIAIYPHTISSNSPQWYEQYQCYVNIVSIPSIQEYRENNISKESVPMVAYKALTENSNYTLQGNLEFRNLYGVLALNLKGEDKVQSITITATDSLGNVAPLSGYATLKRSESEFHIIDMHPVANDPMGMVAMSGTSYITLECPDVQLNTVVPTPFHIALPPGKYSSFNLLITTSEGKVMLVESKKELVINRSKIKHTTPLVYTETVAIDLSERGTSNSYIVSKAGIYKFDASVIGNGAVGITPYATFHTSDPSIAPESVDLLWEDQSGLISALSYNSAEKYITFMSSGQEGNGLIAAKNEDGDIIWSWHIWCTDKPKDHTYINHQNQIFSVMDRNLGATRADRGTGEEWKESVGLHYQWGRKDPFTFGNLHSDNTLTIDQTIQNPTRTGPWSWMNEDTHNHMTYMYLWSDSLKTIYDPCPVGYKVAPSVTWTGFAKNGLSNYGGSVNYDEYNVSGSFDNGWNFIYDGTNTAWYPLTCSEAFYVNDWYGEDGKCWSSTYNHTNNSYALYFRYYDEFSNDLQIGTSSSGEIRNVRCVVDESYVDVSLPTLSTPVVSEISNTSATLSAEAIAKGGSAVIQKGFVWSKSHKPTVDLDAKIIVSSDTGKYSATISNLEQMSGYYVRAFATNSHGTGYSEEVFFSTKYDGIPTNLSNYETSNCYIVSAEGYYSFDASVIGNGTKGIIPNAGFHTSDPSIKPSYANIVWEDRDSLITYLYFDPSKKSINFWASGQEGNALIAAKDQNGTILWSWHIWITDKPADHSYFNADYKNYIVMDRNIGATRADRGTGDEWKESMGLSYQWGRKDPFLYGKESVSYTKFSLEESIKQPTYAANGDGGWLDNSNVSLWTDSTKTIYDPCPLGYRVAPKDTWSGFTDGGVSTGQSEQVNWTGVWDNGFYFKYDGTNTAWYPSVYMGPNLSISYSECECWSANATGSNNDYWTYAHRLYARYSDGLWIEPISGTDHRYSRAVRCVKDQTYNDPSLPSVTTSEVTEITESQALFKGEVTSQGTYDVAERGFLYGTQDIALNVDTATKIVCGNGMGTFENKVLTLTPGTNYHVRSYAINSMGSIVYSETKYFKTKETGSNEDLGEDEYEW